MKRLDKDNYYLNIALDIAKRSTCLRRCYGAVIVNNDEIISSGYNGAPRGRVNCVDCGHCLREELNIPHGEKYEACRSIHAEMNAIISASRKDIIGSTIYLAGYDAETGEELDNALPCKMCERAIINANIRYIINKNSNNPNIIDVNDLKDDFILSKNQIKLCLKEYFLHMYKIDSFDNIELHNSDLEKFLYDNYKSIPHIYKLSDIDLYNTDLNRDIKYIRSNIDSLVDDIYKNFSTEKIIELSNYITNNNIDDCLMRGQIILEDDYCKKILKNEYTLEKLLVWIYGTNINDYRYSYEKGFSNNITEDEKRVIYYICKEVN